MLDQFWEAIGYVFALNAEAFRIATTLPAGLKLALGVVVLAGLSQEIGQIVILFLNRIKPGRFVFSLLINALLFAFGFLALVGSTWLITLAPWTTRVAFKRSGDCAGSGLCSTAVCLFWGPCPTWECRFFRCCLSGICWPW